MDHFSLFFIYSKSFSQLRSFRVFNHTWTSIPHFRDLCILTNWYWTIKWHNNVVSLTVHLLFASPPIFSRFLFVPLRHFLRALCRFHRKENLRPQISSAKFLFALLLEKICINTRLLIRKCFLLSVFFFCARGQFSMWSSHFFRVRHT